MDGKAMYRIDFTDLRKAAEIIYCFLTLPCLHNPECSIWGSDGLPKSVLNGGMGFASEEDFCRKIVGCDFAAVTCVASTDKADKRRVVLNLMDGMDFMVLSFPQANGKPNEAEHRLLKMLEK